MLVKQKRTKTTITNTLIASIVTESRPIPDSANVTFASHAAPPVFVNISAIEIPAPNRRIESQSILLCNSLHVVTPNFGPREFWWKQRLA